MDEVTQFLWWVTTARYTRPWQPLCHRTAYDLDEEYDPLEDSFRDEPIKWLNNNRVLYHIEWVGHIDIGGWQIIFYICFVDKAEAAKFKLYFPHYEPI